MMDRNAFKERFAVRIESVEHEGEVYRVRSMSIRNKVALDGIKDQGEAEKGLWLILHSLCDEAGERLLSDEDLNIVDQLPIELYNKLFRAILNVNGLSETAYEDAKKN